MIDRSHRTVGVLYILLGLPALIALILGKLHRGGDAWFAISILAIPIGVLFLGAGPSLAAGRKAADYAVKLGIFTLLQAGVAVLFFFVVRAGHDRFLTAYEFLAMFASFLSLVAAALLLSARFGRNGDVTASRG